MCRSGETKGHFVPNHPARPWILRGPFFAKHADNRMRNEGDVAGAREHFLKNRPYQLEFLLRKRYRWMQAFLQPADKVVEFGSGAGFSRMFLDAPGLILTDVEPHPWIDEEVDAADPPYEDESLDAVICSYVIHHLAKPAVFLDSLLRLLKPGGYALINEVEPSFMFRLVLRLMRHEGWSYDVDPYDREAICNDPADPWSANVAIPKLLFDDSETFQKEFGRFKILLNRKEEFATFLNSGGVTSKTFYLPLPRFLVRALDGMDRALIYMFPEVFPICRRILLQKTVLERNSDRDAGEGRTRESVVVGQTDRSGKSMSVEAQAY
jgi:SAM-dependent methyltransferase